jgi:hypothetical protein
VTSQDEFISFIALPLDEASTCVAENLSIQAHIPKIEMLCHGGLSHKLDVILMGLRGLYGLVLWQDKNV